MYYHYSPQPPQEYLPADKPAAVPWYGYVFDYSLHSPSSYGLWNLLWLVSPDLDRALHLSRQHDETWASIKWSASLTSLARLWPQLLERASHHPTRFRTWVRENGDAFYFETMAPTELDLLHSRIDDVIARFAETNGPDGPPAYDLSLFPRKEGNVVYLNPRVTRTPQT